MTVTEAPPPPPRWRVQSQLPTTVLDGNGNYVPGHRITVALARGTTFTVDVPNTQYNAERVTELINEKAATVEAIDGLTG